MDVILDPIDRKWGIYQVRSSHILVHPDATIRPWLLWKLEDIDGNPRLFSNFDLQQALRTRHAGEKLWSHGSNNFVDAIEAKEEAKVQAAKDRSAYRAKVAAEQIYGLMNTVHMGVHN